MKAADRAKLDEIMFPGGIPSKTVAETREELEQRTKEAADAGWDANPVLKLRDGEVTEFFYISAIAEALNRKPGTIRAWEDEGVFPHAPYRLKARKGATKRSGRRIYTRDQIDTAVEAAIATKVIDPADSKTVADWPTFTKLVYKAWHQLEQQRKRTKK